jgi:T5SS/PEP-CTERM-associated repeat protein
MTGCLRNVARNIVGLSVGCAICLRFGTLARAVTTNWNTNNSGNFSNAANWDNGVPRTDDTAVFRRGIGATYTVTFTGRPPTVPGGPIHYATDRLVVGSNDVTLVKTFQADYTLLNSTTAEAGRGFVIGELDGDEATLNSTFSLTGVAATIGDAFRSTGTLYVTASTFSLTGSSADDELIIGNLGDGSLNVTGGAQVQVDLVAVNISQDLVLFPAGLVRLQGGTLDTQIVSFHGGGQFEWTGGTLHVATFSGNLLNQGGALAPGHSAGMTTIAGSYTQQAGATLDIELGGTSRGSTYDAVDVTGNASLGGELQLTLLNGFMPTAGNSFSVLSSLGGIAGGFTNVASGERLTTNDGLGSFLVYYGVGSPNPNQIVLTDFQPAGLPGDYNFNGTVDAADYVVWRNGLGTTYNQNDYAVWRSHFGQTAGSGAALPSADPLSATVPEPAALVVVLLITAGISLGRYGKALPVSKLVRA